MVIGFCIGVSLAPVVDLLGTIGEGKNTVFNGALNVGPQIGPLIAMDKAAAGLLKGAPDGSLINSLIPADER